MALNGNDLCIADAGTYYDGNNIYKADISQSNPATEVVATLNTTVGSGMMLLEGNNLYISEFMDGYF